VQTCNCFLNIPRGVRTFFAAKERGSLKVDTIRGNGPLHPLMEVEHVAMFGEVPRAHDSHSGRRRAGLIELDDETRWHMAVLRT
jgi:hypothetical protein